MTASCGNYPSIAAHQSIPDPGLHYRSIQMDVNYIGVCVQTLGVLVFSLSSYCIFMRGYQLLIFSLASPYVGERQNFLCSSAISAWSFGIKDSMSSNLLISYSTYPVQTDTSYICAAVKHVDLQPKKSHRELITQVPLQVYAFPNQFSVLSHEFIPDDFLLTLVVNSLYVKQKAK